MLIRCPECNHEVSDKAATCPHCGIKIAGNPDINVSDSPKHRKSDNKKTSSKGKRWTIVLLIMLFVLAGIAGGAYYLYNQMQQHDEEIAYQQAIDSHNADEMQRFLAHYSDAPQEHRDTIKARLQQMRLDERALEAQAQLDAIDSTDYALAKRLNTIEAYENYLKAHPKSKHIEEIKDLIIEITNSNATTEDIEFAHSICKRFFQAINAHDESLLLSTVPTVLTQFLNRNNAKNVDVLTFMEKLYKPDVNNLNFRIIEPLSAKRVTDADGNMILSTNFTVTLHIDRNDLSKERFATYSVAADITPDGLISKFNLKKHTTQTSSTEYSE